MARLSVQRPGLSLDSICVTEEKPGKAQSFTEYIPGKPGVPGSGPAAAAPRRGGSGPAGSAHDVPPHGRTGDESVVHAARIMSGMFIFTPRNPAMRYQGVTVLRHTRQARQLLLPGVIAY